MALHIKTLEVPGGDPPTIVDLALDKGDGPNGTWLYRVRVRVTKTRNRHTTAEKLVGVGYLNHAGEVVNFEGDLTDAERQAIETVIQGAVR